MINIAICDDFPVFREIIETFIRQYAEKATIYSTYGNLTAVKN